MSRLQRAWAALRALLRTRKAVRGIDAWKRNHTPLQLAYDGRCADCGKPRAMDTEHCPGRDRPWRPPNNATRRCPHTGRGVVHAGCFICDPAFNGGIDRSVYS